MKNKIIINNKEYRQLRSKLFVRTIILAVIAFFSIFLLYKFVLGGHFGNWVVSVLQNYFHMSFDEAMDFYQRTFRNYMELIVVCSMLIVFFIIFHIYLKWFTKYFIEINEGIDALIRENVEDVELAPELAATEKKINEIKHTLTRRKMDAQLAEQRKNDLVVYLAHDLKTPLTSVIGYLTLLRDENQISEELREKYLSISLDKAERLEDLINEFFEITRFNLSEITLQDSRVNLTRLLEQLVFEFQPMLMEKKLQCILNAEENIMIKCDPDKIQRVFDNLLRNAVFYSFENTIIEINVENRESEIAIKVLNHGNTIPEEKLSRIFEQFYRLDTSRSSNNGGADLGLAIAKKIVELHHGTLKAESQNEIIQFVVTLPQK